MRVPANLITAPGLPSAVPLLPCWGQLYRGVILPPALIRTEAVQERRALVIWVDLGAQLPNPVRDLQILPSGEGRKME